MSKETEELIFIGGGVLLLLMLLKGGTSTTALASISAAQNVGFANAGASVLNTALNDFSE